MLINSDEYYMSEALIEANKALEAQDVPIGAVIVFNNEIIARGFNQVEKLKDSTAHAELIAIKEATQVLGYKYLLDCSLYVTLEPCSMCSGAIVLSRIPNLFFGTNDPKAGASGSLYSITNDARLNHRCTIKIGILKDQCSELIIDFFKNLRIKN